ncbi:MAG TPA: hypothetical protein VEB69_00350 [Acidimicrobiia bacterium]|nr:hypothetical protein [Acidimicrobiia bacterium]
MGTETLSRRLGGTMAIATLIIAVAIPLTAAGKPDKITICHAAGHDGTDNFVTLELSWQAVYGNGGHFEENGTPSAGHQGDSLGACVGDSPSTSEDTAQPEGGGPTTTLSDDTSSSTGGDENEAGTVEETTTTAPFETTTTGSDVDVPEVGSIGAATSTTVGSERSTSTAKVPEVASVDAGSGRSDREGVEVGNAVATEAGQEAPATLPFTGLNESLVIPAALLLLTGAITVFFSGGDRRVSGVHMAVDAERIGLGLHRGRHESD